MSANPRASGAPDLLRVIPLEEVGASAPTPIDADTLESAREIVARVRAGGSAAVRQYAERLDALDPKDQLVLGPGDLARAAASIPPGTLALLKRVAARVHSFAVHQRGAIQPLDVPIEEGRAGHDVAPVDAAGSTPRADAIPCRRACS